ncbi:MAG: hypothetical protein ACYTGC_11940, partial [Planctomycetota bacterium]
MFEATLRLVTRTLAVPSLLWLMSCATGESTQPADARAPTTGVAGQETDDPLVAAYEKREYLIPMRDGVKLFTAVYAPRDAEEPLPIMLLRTPYSCRPYGEDAYR